MSKPLYALQQEYLELLELADSAEPTDQQMFQDTLEGLQGDIKAKLLNIAALLRSLDSQADAVKAEEDRLAARRKAMENSSERLKAYAKKAMESTGVEKAKNELFTIWLQNNPASCVLDDSLDPAKLPKQYQRIKIEPDKKAIMDDLKQGIQVAGAKIEVGKGVRVR